MVPFIQLFSLVWLLEAACCAVDSGQLPTVFFGRSGGRVSDDMGRPPMQMGARCENAAALEALAENTGNFDDCREKGAAVVEGLAENTRDFDGGQKERAAGVEGLVKKSGVLGSWSVLCARFG